jgi:hypothetical protein
MLRVSGAGKGVPESEAVMFFLVRCVFWLTIVYMTIFSPDQQPEIQPRQTAAVTVPAPAKADMDASTEAMSRGLRNWATGAIEHFWTKAAGSCASAPAQCAGVAERLTDFAKQHPFKDADGTATPAKAVPVSAMALRPSFPADVPLPPLRPTQIRLLERTAAPRAFLLRPTLIDWQLRG